MEEDERETKRKREKEGKNASKKNIMFIFIYVIYKNKNKEKGGRGSWPGHKWLDILNARVTTSDLKISTALSSLSYQLNIVVREEVPFFFVGSLQFFSSSYTEYCDLRLIFCEINI